MNGYFAPQCLTHTLEQQRWTQPRGMGNYFWQHSCLGHCLVTRVVLTYYANPLPLPVLFSNKMYVSKNFIGFYFHFRWRKWQKLHSQLNEKKASSLQCHDFSSTHRRTMKSTEFQRVRIFSKVRWDTHTCHLHQNTRESGGCQRSWWEEIS